MTRQRSVVDYSLQRRAVLADLRRGLATRRDVCDAHVYLLRAARYHGEATGRPCPVCLDERLSEVHYVYGDRLGRAAGQAHRLSEMAHLVDLYGSFTVYVVEVCRGCEWNHLCRSYVLDPGLSGDPGRDDGRPRRVEA